MRYNISLNKWNFSIEELNYHTKVTLPHTWNVDDEVMQYRGKAIYECRIFVPSALEGKKARLYFGAVYHSAEVYINGNLAAVHSRSGYTPFTADAAPFIRTGEENTIKVIADNTPSPDMLPYMHSFDWADDGGIIRKCELRFTEPDAAEFLHAEEDISEFNDGECSGRFILTTAFADGKPKDCTVKIKEYMTNKVVLTEKVKNAENRIILNFKDLKVWSNEAPNLYLISLETENDFIEIRTGIRKIEVSGERILLNGKDVFLKGCEWMPGSHPDFGMAEPTSHIIMRLKQLKNSGCIFTRFHWQQDDELFDWCDENGLLVQEEIPYWGYSRPVELQYDIAKQQADDMVSFHMNHPSIVCWGVGNELCGEAEETIHYTKYMSAYFKSKDSRRLVNYVSNSVAGLINGYDDASLYGDIVMWNEYLGLWHGCEQDEIEGIIRATTEKCKGHPLVITEFGLCEPAFSGGDERRSNILRERLTIYPTIENIRGYVWFSLNDYRTHMGEDGEGRLRQRVHGSTDMYGNEKPSYRLLTELQEIKEN